MAQTVIHRCIGANGNPVFTDQPCAALQATRVNPAPTTTASQPGQPPPIMCAATVAQLRQSVVEAFAHHDANRMAGLMLWNGYSGGAAVADIRSLASLMRQPLLDINLAATSGALHDDLPPPANTSSSAGPNAPATLTAGSQLVLHTVGNGGNEGPGELRLDIVHQAGCLWLRNPD
jgi:hypothetical protein